MQMIAHKTPTMQHQTFFSLAGPNTGEDNIPIIFSCKNIDPRLNDSVGQAFDYGKCYKMYCCRISDLVASNTHFLF